MVEREWRSLCFPGVKLGVEFAALRLEDIEDIEDFEDIEQHNYTFLCVPHAATLCLCVKARSELPVAGLEPTPSCPEQILSLPCLPFHHTG